MQNPDPPNGPRLAGTPTAPVYPVPTSGRSKGLVPAVVGGTGVLVIASVATAVILMGDETPITPPDPTSTTASPRHSEDSAFPNAAEQELLRHIPPFVQAYDFWLDVGP